MFGCLPQILAAGLGTRPHVTTHGVVANFGETTGPGFLIAVFAALFGFLLLWNTKRQERKNFVAGRAPRLPIRALSEHDDAWISGVVTDDQPFRCPHFGTSCVYYAYKIEKRVTRVVRDSKGRTRTVTSWQTEYSESDIKAFWLVDETSGIFVEARKASFEALPSTGYDYSGFGRRHVATMLPVGVDVFALGVKVEGDRFGPLGRVPLIITTRTHEEHLKRGDRSEAMSRGFGLFLILVAGVVLGAMLFAPESRFGASWRDANWPLGALVGFAIWLPLWAWSSYNRFVRQRQTTEAAWRQIDVDMDVRLQTVPKLVAVTKGYAAHEAELFETLARLRMEKDASVRDTVRKERERSRAVRSLLALDEKYPQLRADELFRQLHEKLWALEEKIAASREFYDKNALEWNRLVQSFPTNLLAGAFGFESRAYFGAIPDERRATRVKIGA